MLPHGSYLVNLANPDPAKREKSYECFLNDLQRCEAFGMGLYNFQSVAHFVHIQVPVLTLSFFASPGSPMKEDRATAIGYVAESVNRAHRATSSIIIILENMVRSDSISQAPLSD